MRFLVGPAVLSIQESLPTRLNRPDCVGLFTSFEVDPGQFLSRLTSVEFFHGPTSLTSFDAVLAGSDQSLQSPSMEGSDYLRDLREKTQHPGHRSGPRKRDLFVGRWADRKRFQWRVEKWEQPSDRESDSSAADQPWQA